MPRAGLSTERVVAEAAVLSDEIGYDRLTLTVLAERLGVAVPSLYKHVDGLDALRLGVATLAARELGAAMREAADDAGRPPEVSALAAIAGGYRAYAKTHPGRYGATVRAARATGQPELAAAGEEAVNVVLPALSAIGLEGERSIHAARSLRAAIHGFVTLEAAGGFGRPEDIDSSFDFMIAALEQGLSDAASDRATSSASDGGTR
jgi:AcrR family transcriptional regulator